MRIYRSHLANLLLVVTNHGAAFELIHPGDSILKVTEKGISHIINRSADLYLPETEGQETLSQAGYVIDPLTVPDDTVPQTPTPRPGG